MANYDGLTESQQAEFDGLMVMKMSEWPAELHGWMKAHSPIYCGDQMADEVAGWVRSKS
jgi:hypothetical protein